MQEELQRLLVDEAEEAEANCTVDELLSALRKTHRAMTVEESALRAFLKVLDEDGVINIGLILALAFGATAFLGKLTAEWYRYTGRMRGIETEMSSARPQNLRGLDQREEIDDRLPTGVTLEESGDK